MHRQCVAGRDVPPLSPHCLHFFSRLGQVPVEAIVVCWLDAEPERVQSVCSCNWLNTQSSVFGLANLQLHAHVLAGREREREILRKGDANKIIML